MTKGQLVDVDAIECDVDRHCIRVVSGQVLPEPMNRPVLPEPSAARFMQ